jgi:hypothetical protein
MPYLWRPRAACKGLQAEEILFLKVLPRFVPAAGRAAEVLRAVRRCPTWSKGKRTAAQAVQEVPKNSPRQAESLLDQVPAMRPTVYDSIQEDVLL